MRNYALLFLFIVFWGCADNIENLSCDNSLRVELKNFADENWSLNNWVINRFALPTHMHESMGWNNFNELTTLSGTRDLTLVASSELAAELNITLVSSDSLEPHPYWFFNGDVSILRDSMFYINIGKYNQFMGGWSDAQNSWYWEQVDSNISTEPRLSTPLKDDYIAMFPDCD